MRLITSQNDTAPKLAGPYTRQSHRLITSQNDTAPKPLEQILLLQRRQ